MALKVGVKALLVSSDSLTSVEIERQEWNMPLGKRYQLLVGNMSVMVIPERLDSIRCQLTVSLSTFGPNPFAKSALYTMELGLPAMVRGVPGKAGAEFRLLLTPLAYTNDFDSTCEYSPYDSTSFKSDPSANFDLYFTPGSLGDAHWNNIKLLLEQEYRKFLKDFDISVAGKEFIYLYPCAASSVPWDKRYGYSIDPSRQVISTVYSHEFISVSPILCNQTKLLRVWGYAPPFLTEGIASYYSFPDYECLVALKNDGLIPLDSLVNTKRYYEASFPLAGAEAGSFCRYLSDTKGISSFRALYERSDDLTIQKAFADVYGKSLNELEGDWIAYLRSLKPRREQFEDRALLEGGLNHVTLKRDILETLLARDTTAADTIRTLTLLAPVYSELGEYRNALVAFQRLLQLTRKGAAARTNHLQRIADLQLSLGEFDKAKSTLHELTVADSAMLPVALYQRGRIELLLADTSAARATFDSALKVNQDPSAEAEISLRLGFIRSAPGKYADKLVAVSHFGAARDAANLQLQRFPNSSLDRLRLGLALMGLGEYADAKTNLEEAYFLEFRAQFRGRMLLALGNLSDITGDRKKAREYYQQATKADRSTPTATEATAWLAKPFGMMTR